MLPFLQKVTLALDKDYVVNIRVPAPVHNNPKSYQASSTNQLGGSYTNRLAADESLHSLHKNPEGIEGDLLREECLKLLSFFLAHCESAATTSVPVKKQL